MNISQVEELSPVITPKMPQDARERWEWFTKQYGAIVTSHIEHLKRFKILPDKLQWLSFTGIMDAEYAKVQYGALLIEFPHWLASLKQWEWMAKFDVVVDHQVIVLDTWIASVPHLQINTSTSASRLFNKLLPWIDHHTTTNLSSRCIPRRIIRIQEKK